MNIQYEFWKLIARIKDSDFVKNLKIFYREEPWACTIIFAVGMLFTGLMSWLVFMVIYLTWPNSLYVLMSIAAIIWGARGILDWISRD